MGFSVSLSSILYISTCIMYYKIQLEEYVYNNEAAMGVYTDNEDAIKIGFWAGFSLSLFGMATMGCT